VHTAEEAWAAIKSKSQTVESVHLAEMPKIDEAIDWRSQQPRWDKMMALRDEVLRVLEGLRQEKKIASNQEASVTIGCGDEELAAIINEFRLEQFATLCIVSEVKFDRGPGQTTVTADKSIYQKCQRCWNYWPTVGQDSEHPDLCKRCADTIRSK
jgi:isoleucyl-tRNA synthetase